MIKIGHRTLLSAHSLLIPGGEEARIDLDFFGWNVFARISFNDDGSEQGIAIESELDINGRSGVHLKFIKWDNILGTTLFVPQRFAELVNNGAVDFMCMNYRIGSVNKFDIQFLHNHGGR